MNFDKDKLIKGELITILQNFGYKLTYQRRVMLESIIRNSDKHMKIEDIYDDIKSHDKDIGIATIYRTMQLFEEIGLVKSINFGDGYLRYHVIYGEKKRNHYHFVCKICGEVVDIHKDLMDFFENDDLKDRGFLLTGYEVQLIGICKKCFEKINKDKI